MLDLVKDATTNAPINQIDYLYNGGVHQVNPAGKGFCEMELYLTDSAAAQRASRTTSTTTATSSRPR